MLFVQLMLASKKKEPSLFPNGETWDATAPFFFLLNTWSSCSVVCGGNSGKTWLRRPSSLLSLTKNVDWQPVVHFCNYIMALYKDLIPAMHTKEAVPSTCLQFLFGSGWELDAASAERLAQKLLRGNELKRTELQVNWRGNIFKYKWLFVCVPAHPFSAQLVPLKKKKKKSQTQPATN